MVAYTCNPRTWMVEVGGLQVGAQPWLLVRPCLEKAEGWWMYLMAQHFPSMCKTLCSVPSTSKKMGCVCESVCVRVYIYTDKHSREGRQGCLVSFPIFLLWSRVLHWTESLLFRRSWYTSKRLWPTWSHPEILGLQVCVAMPGFSQECWGFELGPHAYETSILTHWALAPVPS